VYCELFKNRAGDQAAMAALEETALQGQIEQRLP
jgi:hypothetical protein